jgi:hypothetical protein
MCNRSWFFNLQLTCFGAMLFFATSCWAQLAILEYGFNEPGGSRAESTGSNKTPLTMRSKTLGLPQDYHGPDMSGVTNQRGDRAFYNRDLGGLAGSTGYADQPYVADIDGLSSFTLTAWMAPIPQPIPAGTPEILFFKFDSNHGFVAQFLPGNDTSFRAGLSVDGASAITGAIYPYTPYDFFAVSYDGTAQTDNVKFYLGRRGNGAAAQVRLVNTATINQGAVDATNAGLILGSQRTGLSPFLGVIDDARIFGTKNANDPRGALSLDQLEAVRRFNLITLSVPEPASGKMMMIGGVLLVAVVFVRRLRGEITA